MTLGESRLAAKRLRDLLDQGRDQLKLYSALLGTVSAIPKDLWAKIDDATDDLVESLPEERNTRWTSGA